MKSKRDNASWVARLRRRPVLWNLALIAMLFVVLMIVAYIGLAVATRHGMRRTVPDFTGLALKDAEYYAAKKGLNLIINDSLYVPAYPGGMVLDQLPKGGVDVKEGRKIYLTINSFAQKKLPLPYVAGRSLRQAKNMLENAGFEIAWLEYVPDMATNYVLQQFLGGTEITESSSVKVEKGTGVTLRVGVSETERTTTTPRLIGRALFDAKGRLWEQGLNVGKITYDEDITLLNQNDARVCNQSALQGSTLPLGTEVSLHLTLDRERVERAAADAERAVEQAIEAQQQADSLAAAAAAQVPAETEIIEQTQSAEDEFFF